MGMIFVYQDIGVLVLFLILLVWLVLLQMHQPMHWHAQWRSYVMVWRLSLFGQCLLVDVS